ncbi:ABC transporter ATP-binding protein [Bradyrhizobium tropiciagri]|uniref:dipeptide ABC transporter ATP-binding protein n=1 Tax=Bradyrhizobium tropiciagri TaxID=312253 RepID=UPI001BA56791|nr:ABC transporter ATP-binding protein [Bradyrhizobium tropiciagri]MBR0898987.1 ABC transporter ATP-binding protein [Bradyrhizobium tropiciagri]
MSEAPAAILSAESLSVNARNAAGRPLLDDISFTLARGQVIGVIGESGSGKTLLARALVNWLPPNLRYAGGRVLFRGQDMLAKRTRTFRGREMAYIGSNAAAALDPTLPIGHQIVEKLRCVNSAIGRNEARDKVISLLEATRIPSPSKRFHEYPSEFSGGMMQRVMIVDALVSDPAFLVADNITQPLDVTVAQQILRILRRLCDELGTAIVFVTSSLPTVRQIANEIFVINAGRIVEHQTADALVGSPTHDYTRNLIAKTPRIWSLKDEPVRSSYDSEARPLLQVRDVFRSYRVRQRGKFNSFNTIAAVRGVSFDVRAGENFGIVGESGCGKSTLSRLFARLEAPDNGDIVFDGASISQRRDGIVTSSRQSYQLVLQDPFGSLPPRMTIGRIIAEGLMIRERSALKQLEPRVKKIMVDVGLDPALFPELPTTLSAGQRQRIGVARAMILNPRLLILDETMSSLDPGEQFALLELFRRLQRERDLTYIFISHDMALVRSACTRVAVMYLGEIVELADTRDLFENPQHPYTRALLSAVPTLDMRPYDSRKYLLDGEPPSPIDLPTGCSFRSRCPLAFERCAVESPKLLPQGRSQSAACFCTEPLLTG